MSVRAGLGALVLSIVAAFGARAEDALPTMVEPPFLQAAVTEGKLQPVAERIPKEPLVVSFEGDQVPGRYGGTLRLLGGSAKDTRMLVIYGYARLVGYNTKYEIVPDIAKSVDVVEGRK